MEQAPMSDKQKAVEQVATPRTDAVAMDFRRQTVGGVESAIDFARQLERELNAAIRERDGATQSAFEQAQANMRLVQANLDLQKRAEAAESLVSAAPPEGEREAFEEAAFAQRFLSSIVKNRNVPKPRISGALDYVSEDCPYKADFIAKNPDGSYKEESLNPAWWAWQKRAARPVAAPLREALAELVRLEKLRAWLANPESGLHTREQRKQWQADYNTNKPLAWDRARALLEDGKC